MSDALKRRCLHLFIDYPDAARELEIVQRARARAPPTLAEAVVGVVQRVRELDLKKRPSVSETLDWARALTILNAGIASTTRRTLLIKATAASPQAETPELCLPCRLRSAEYDGWRRSIRASGAREACPDGSRSRRAARNVSGECAAE